MIDIQDIKDHIMQLCRNGVSCNFSLLFNTSDFSDIMQQMHNSGLSCSINAPINENLSGEIMGVKVIVSETVPIGKVFIMENTSEFIKSNPPVFVNDYYTRRTPKKIENQEEGHKKEDTKDKSRKPTDKRRVRL